MKINRLLTLKNFDNTNNPKRIKYIVIHYVGATGGAESNCRYFRSMYRGASAHYFVGHKGEVWQCVLDEDVAWHCGAKKYKHPYCRNSNSIAVEMCVKKRKNQWYFEDATVDATVELVKELMAKYKVPASNVLRHYDVTGKICPEPFVSNKTKHTWQGFLQKIKNKQDTAQKTIEKSSAFKIGDKVKLTEDAVYYSGGNIPSWVKKSTLYIRDMSKDRIVVSTQKTGAVTGAVNIKYLR